MLGEVMCNTEIQEQDGMDEASLLGEDLGAFFTVTKVAVMPNAIVQGTTTLDGAQRSAQTLEEQWNAKTL